MRKLIRVLAALSLVVAGLTVVTPASAGNREDIALSFEKALNVYNAQYCGGYDVDSSSSRQNLEEWRQQQRATTTGWQTAHIDQYGKRVWDYADNFNVDDWTGAGEIVADLNYWNSIDVTTGMNDAPGANGISDRTEDIIKAWHDSDTHRDIMQTCSYDSFGAGVYEKSNGNVLVGVIYTNQPLRYANVTSGVGMWTGAGLCGEDRIGVLPYNARLIQYGHKTSSCDGALWYFVRWQEDRDFTGWVKGSKVRSTP